jgi:hypothetical protein
VTPEEVSIISLVKRLNTTGLRDEAMRSSLVVNHLSVKEKTSMGVIDSEPNDIPYQNEEDIAMFIPKRSGCY